MAPRVVRYSERPELWERIEDLSSAVWPEYNLHGEELDRYWARLYEDFPDWQFVLYEPDEDAVLAEGHTIPVGWDGTYAGLGPGIDATIAAGFRLRSAGGQPTAASALAAEIPPQHRSRGLAPLPDSFPCRLPRLAHIRLRFEHSRYDMEGDPSSRKGE